MEKAQVERLLIEFKEWARTAPAEEVIASLRESGAFGKLGTCHSPGPWRLTQRGEGLGACRVLLDANDKEIMAEAAYDDSFPPSDDADWRLIAAAPTMLRMLEIAAGEMTDADRANIRFAAMVIRRSLEEPLEV